VRLRRVAIVGATGAVGAVFLKLLEERAFPLDSLRLLASGRSAGRTIRFRGIDLPVEELRPEAFEGIDLVLSSTPASVSKTYSPLAVQAGAVVVDNSSAWRMDPEVPLVVPEVNPEAIAQHRGIIANPNCSTIQMVVALKPLHDFARIRQIVVSTYQSVSGAGQTGLNELESQRRALAAGQPLPPPAKFPHPIVNACLPQIDEFDADGYTKEEWKMIRETRKILGDDTIQVAPTCVRVPVPMCHSESIRVETERPIEPDQARALWNQAPGVELLDDPAAKRYPLADQAAGRDPVYVGRVRRDPDDPHALLFWCVADNLRKGAALNAVQIAEHLQRHGS